jgi:hypothetical protein
MFLSIYGLFNAPVSISDYTAPFSTFVKYCSNYIAYEHRYVSSHSASEYNRKPTAEVPKLLELAPPPHHVS